MKAILIESDDYTNQNMHGFLMEWSRTQTASASLVNLFNIWFFCVHTYICACVSFSMNFNSMFDTCRMVSMFHTKSCELP